jgi:glucosamine-6-phosphate deaminase
LNIVISKTYDEMSSAAARDLAAFLTDLPACTLGLATGSTPIGMYDALVKAALAKEISFAGVETFNLDEYCGLEPTDPQSYRFFMNTHLFDHVDIDHARTHLPCGVGADEQMCADYESAIETAGGIDLQVLGLGNNGHIGFNEPADDFAATTHLVDLHERTIEANARLFEHVDHVPRRAITMGIGTIMKAARIVVLVSGEGKADIVRDVIEGPVVPQVPASVLQLHRDVTFYLDEAAASKLSVK